MARVEIDEEFLTVAEVAEVLKLNQQTVRNWIDQGTLPALRVGRRVRIKRSDFNRILEESYSGQPTPSDVETTTAGASTPGGSTPGAPPAAGADSGADAGADAATGSPPTTDAELTNEQPTPSAQDFWDGEPVGIPEPAPGRAAAP